MGTLAFRDCPSLRPAAAVAVRAVTDTGASVLTTGLLRARSPIPAFHNERDARTCHTWHDCGPRSLPALGTVVGGGRDVRRTGCDSGATGPLLVLSPLKSVDSLVSPCLVSRTVGRRGRVSPGSPEEFRPCLWEVGSVGGDGIGSPPLCGGSACPETQGGAGIQMGRPQAHSCCETSVIPGP